MILAAVALLCSGAVAASAMDLTGATVVVPASVTALEKKAAAVLIEEVEKPFPGSLADFPQPTQRRFAGGHHHPGFRPG
jgi:hypothetical protein